MELDEEIDFTKKVDLQEYIRKYQRKLAIDIVKKYTEVRQYKDPKYKFNFDMSVHDMLWYPTDISIREQVKLITNMYHMNYQTFIQGMNGYVMDELSTWQAFKGLFFCMQLGSYHCPDVDPFAEGYVYTS